MAPGTVLIIGAGLGGLTLARALRKQNIPFKIFERDPPNDVRAQGWAISLHPWLMDDIRSAIRDDEAGLRAMAPSAPLGLGSEGVIYSVLVKRKELFRFGDGTDRPFVRVDRGQLRKWLLEGIDVEWGKRFARYEQDEEGVTAHFEDGSTARGAILVGADGISSRVRRQLAPEGEPQRLPIGIVVGEVKASPEQYQRWLKLAHSFSVGFVDTRRLFVGLKSVAPDRSSAQIYWMFGWADEKAKSDDFWTMTASQKELHDYVNANLNMIDPDYIEPFQATPVEGILQPPLQMRDMVPPPLPTGRVTLLGDAVHPMVPFRGEGGNMAMKDAIVIAEELSKVQDHKNIASILKDYEAEMTARANESVLRSRESTFMHEEIFSN